MVDVMQLGCKHFQASLEHASVPQSAPGRNCQRTTAGEVMEEGSSKCDAVPEEDDIVWSDQGQQAHVRHKGVALSSAPYNLPCSSWLDLMHLYSLYPRLNLPFSTAGPPFGILHHQIPMRCLALFNNITRNMLSVIQTELSIWWISTIIFGNLL